MRITVLAVGKVKEKFYRDALAEYVKRLGRYCKLQIIEVEDEKTEDGGSKAEEELVKEKEGKRLQKYLHQDAYRIALAIDGKKLDSVAFSKKLDHLAVSGKSHIIFVIGGSLGLHDEVLRAVDEKMSFSDLTFPHQLMRVILLEQIYRGFRISCHEPYHK